METDDTTSTRAASCSASRPKASAPFAPPIRLRVRWSSSASSPALHSEAKRRRRPAPVGRMPAGYGPASFFSFLSADRTSIFISELIRTSILFSAHRPWLEVPRVPFESLSSLI